MTSTNAVTKTEAGSSVILKTDTKGRVRVPRGKREELLLEYERSGMSAAEFAKWCGVKYTTLCGWINRKRREVKATVPGEPVKWLEAVVGSEPGAVAGAGVVIHWGAVRVEVSDAKTAIEMLRQLAFAGHPPKVGVKPC